MNKILNRIIHGTGIGFLIALAFLLASGKAYAVDRSTTERYAFDRMTPCPVATANPHVCPGYIRASVIPLSCARTPEERDWLDSRFNKVWLKDGDYHIRVGCLYLK